MLARLQASDLLDGIAGEVWDSNDWLRQSGHGSTRKFAQDPDSFTLEYASLNIFFEGLEGLRVHQARS